METYHTPVLFKETIKGLNIKANGTYLDCTLGGGGHSEGILENLDKGSLIALDQDQNAIDFASKRLEKYSEKLTIVKSNFVRAPEVLRDLNINTLDGVLLDIGVSSHQIDDASRGFSYIQDGVLDMRMDLSSDFTAFDIVNTYSQEQLKFIFQKFGEEKFSGRIARAIVERRKTRKIQTTLELSNLIKESVPNSNTSSHPAKQVFQALRIEVNKELDVLSKSLENLVAFLKPAGRICVITFHSLEDRIVKNKFREMTQNCICPSEIPICVCNHKKTLKLINKKPIVASDDEIYDNSRSASAKLRIGEKI